MTERKVFVSIRLFGAFSLSVEGAGEIAVPNKKIRALLALLATAPGGKRTRAFLQENLWPLSGASHGRASLRGALSALKKAVGPAYEEIIDAAGNDEIRLQLPKVALIGGPEEGEFLEGMDIPGAQDFENWLRDQRQGHVAGLPAFPKSSRGLALEPAAEERLRPAIIILPFRGAGTDPATGVLGDMVAEQLSRYLSQSAHLDVISHLSSRAIDPALIQLREIGDLFDVDYVVTGMLRPGRQGHRADLDFIDARTGGLCWSRPFVMNAEDFLSGQDLAIEEMADSLLDGVVETAIEHALSQPLASTSMHTLLTAAIALMHRQDLHSFALARRNLEELIERAPRASVLQGWLGMWYVLFITQGWSTDLKADISRGLSATRRALDLNPNCAFSLTVESMLESNAQLGFSDCVGKLNQALLITPNLPMAWAFKGTIHAFRGNGDQAVAYTERARFLSPKDPASYLLDVLSATAHLAKGEFQVALDLAERSEALNPNHLSTLRVKTIALHGLERMQEARETALRLLARQPDLTVSGYVARHPSGQFDIGHTWAEALGECGVPTT